MTNSIPNWDAQDEAAYRRMCSYIRFVLGELREVSWEDRIKWSASAERVFINAYHRLRKLYRVTKRQQITWEGALPDNERYATYAEELFTDGSALTVATATGIPTYPEYIKHRQFVRKLRLLHELVTT